MRTSLAGWLLAPLAAAALAGCTATVAMEAAPAANDPACAEVIVSLPDAVAELPSRETDAQATGAWGEPARVLLTCGVPVPPPTSEFACITVEGIDWLRDATDEPVTVFTTYGRDPAVQVVVDGEFVSGGPALSDLASAVGTVPATRECVDPEEALVPEE